VDQEGSGRWGRAAVVGRILLAVVATALLILVIVRIVSPERTIQLVVGGTADTNNGLVTVHGWEPVGDDVLVSITACRNGAGSIADLGAFRLVKGDTELEPSGSRFAPAEDGAADSLEGELQFRTSADGDSVVYRSSPVVTWRPAP
jgi:hypothetical protein